MSNSIIFSGFFFALLGFVVQVYVIVNAITKTRYYVLIALLYFFGGTIVLAYYNVADEVAADVIWGGILIAGLAQYYLLKRR